MATQYRQCRLTRTPSEAVTQTRMLWLPVQFTEPGMVLKLHDNGEWVDGWRVMHSDGPVLDEKPVTVLNRAHLKQRKASDV